MELQVCTILSIKGILVTNIHICTRTSKLGSVKGSPNPLSQTYKLVCITPGWSGSRAHVLSVFQAPGFSLYWHPKNRIKCQDIDRERKKERMGPKK